MTKIYKITNTFIDPPKSYIGRTNKELEDRFIEHIRLGKKGVNRELSFDLMYYGKINFTIELLEEIEFEKSQAKEGEYIKLYNTHFIDGYGYNMRHEDIESKPKIENWNLQDEKRKCENIQSGKIWNKGIQTKKYISEKIKNTIKNKKENGWNNPAWGHKHSEETKKFLSENKKKYYEKNRPHNTIEWIIEYENGTTEKTNALLQKLGSKKEYNKITKWCRENPNKLHPKMKMKVYHA
jgi:group I intron endonuclease